MVRTLGKRSCQRCREVCCSCQGVGRAPESSSGSSCPSDAHSAAHCGASSDSARLAGAARGAARPRIEPRSPGSAAASAQTPPDQRRALPSRSLAPIPPAQLSEDQHRVLSTAIAQVVYHFHAAGMSIPTLDPRVSHQAMTPNRFAWPGIRKLCKGAP